MSNIRKTLNNLAHVVGGELLLRLANLAVAVLIGRLYGVAVLGYYATILAVATVAERVADNGLELTGIAEVSSHPENLNRIWTALYVNKTTLSLAAIALLAAAAYLRAIPINLRLVAVILVVRTFLYSYCRLNAGFLKALDQTKYIVSVQAVHFSILAVAVTSIYLCRQSLVALLFCLLAAQFLELVSTVVILRQLGLRLSSVAASFCWTLLRRSTPVGLTYTFSNLMLRGDVVVLSLIASASVVGAFAAADTGLVMVYVIAWSFSGILLSDLGRLSQNREAFESHFRKCLRGVVLLTVPAAVLCAVLARFAIQIVFGTSFAAAGLPGAVMMVALPFIFLNGTFLSRAIARNAGHIALAIYGCGAVLSLLLNYFLGRWQGAFGVAASILIREAVMTCALVRFWNLPDCSVEASAAFESSPEFARLWNS